MKRDKWQQKLRVPDTYYINNDCTNVIKVHEDCLKFRTGGKHKKSRKKKNLVFQKNS